MENQNQAPLVEIDYINIPVLLFHGETDDIQSNIVYKVDEDGIRTLVTSEENAKNILFNVINQSKEEQEIINKFREEDNSNAAIIVELPCEGKDFIKGFNYGISLEFLGYNSENNNPQFKIVYDAISGNPRKTIKSLNSSKIINEQLELF